MIPSYKIVANGCRQALHVIFCTACAVFFLLFAGCATTQDMTELREEVISLRRTVMQTQANQADISVTMKELNSSMISLSEKLSESSARASALNQKLDDVEANLSQKIEALSTGTDDRPDRQEPTPSQLYELASRDYAQGRYDLASAGFREYLIRYPKGELAEQSLYYLADCLIRINDIEGAKNILEKFIEEYPRSAFHKDAQEKLNNITRNVSGSKS